jgi:hypothetical protein
VTSWCWLRRKSGLALCDRDCCRYSAAALSTADGLLLTIANALSHDLYYKMIDPNASTARRVTLSKMLLLVVALAAAGVASQKPADILFLCRRPSTRRRRFSRTGAGNLLKHTGLRPPRHGGRIGTTFYMVITRLYAWRIGCFADRTAVGHPAIRPEQCRWFW